MLAAAAIQRTHADDDRGASRGLVLFRSAIIQRDVMTQPWFKPFEKRLRKIIPKLSRADGRAAAAAALSDEVNALCFAARKQLKTTPVTPRTIVKTTQFCLTGLLFEMDVLGLVCRSVAAEPPKTHEEASMLLFVVSMVIDTDGLERSLLDPKTSGGSAPGWAAANLFVDMYEVSGHLIIVTQPFIDSRI